MCGERGGGPRHADCYGAGRRTVGSKRVARGRSRGQADPMSDQVVVSRSDGICEIQLNRPEKRNAITLAMYGALVDALNEVRADDSA